MRCFSTLLAAVMSIAHLGHMKRVSRTLARSASKVEVDPSDFFGNGLQPQPGHQQFGDHSSFPAWQPPPGNNLGGGPWQDHVVFLFWALSSPLHPLYRNLQNLLRRFFPQRLSNNQAEPPVSEQPPVSDVDAARAALDRAEAELVASQEWRINAAKMLDAAEEGHINAAKVALDQAEAMLKAAEEAVGALPPRSQRKLDGTPYHVAQKEREGALVTKLDAQRAVHMAEGDVSKARNRWCELVHSKEANGTEIAGC